MWPRIALTLSLTACTYSAAAEPPTTDLRLTLPVEFYAVADVETNIYFDNIVLTETPEDYQFQVQCDVGETERNRWHLHPTAADVGTHELSVTVRDHGGRPLGRKSTRLIVSPANAGHDRRVALLIVGDSLTHATLYPNEIARLLNGSGNPQWQMLGTHRPSNALPGVAHEGYGGWTWKRFASMYEPQPDGTHRKRSSPFVFLNDDGQPELDVTRYFHKNSNGTTPDFIFFLLGINDCFSADPDDGASIDSRIDMMFDSASTVLASFRQAAPHATLAVCVTTPPNSREAAFEANYQGRYHRWGWKRIQHRLVERLLDRFEKSNSDPAASGPDTFVVPTHLNLDPVDGYPENNGVHPNASGYRQIAASIYAWLKCRLNQD